MRNTTRTSSASAALFYSHLKSKGENILAKATALRINLNVDGSPIASRVHTHPSQSQTSRLLSTTFLKKEEFTFNTADSNI
jgi:hypothetical protein